MGRIIVTTCGTSLLESACWIDSNGNPKPISSATNERDRAERRKEWRNWISIKTKEYKESEILIDSFNPLCWNDNMLIDLPAELASLRAMDLYFQTQMPQGITNNDKIHLLVSDTVDGKFCGEVLKKILKDKLNLQVEQEVVENLDLTDSSKFATGMGTLISKVNSLIGQRDGEIIFNLTGGYKSVAIAISGYLMAQGRRNIQIFNLYEDADKISVMTFKENGDIEFGEYNIKKQRLVSTTVNINANTHGLC